MLLVSYRAELPGVMKPLVTVALVASPSASTTWSETPSTGASCGCRSSPSATWSPSAASPRCAGARWREQAGHSHVHRPHRRNPGDGALERAGHVAASISEAVRKLLLNLHDDVRFRARRLLQFLQDRRRVEPFGQQPATLA